MIYKARKYQARVLDKTWGALQKKNNALIVAPCGAGKTFLFAKLIQRLLSENPSFRVLILVDRSILAIQAKESLIEIAPELRHDIGMVCASVDTKKDATKRITIASRQSLANMLNVFEPVQLLICDECHLLPIPHIDSPSDDQYSVIIERLREYNPNMRLLGVTASPYRIGSKGGYIYGDRNRPEAIPYWQDVDAKITYQELTEQGYLAPLSGQVSNDDIDFSGVDIVAGDYNQGQLSELMGQHIHTVKIAIDEYCEGRKKIICFCVDVAHTEAVAKSIGDCATPYHSKMTKEQQSEALEGFKSGKYRVIVSILMLAIGFNVSSVDAIVSARKTLSPALWMQSIGRGLRIAEGKIDCILLDLVGNSQMHTPLNDLDKVIVKIPKKSGGEGESPYKICEGVLPDGTLCQEKHHPSVLICSVCGYRYEKQIAESLPDLKQVEFSQFKPDPPEWIDVVDLECTIHEKGDKELLRVTISLDTLHRYSSASVWICTDPKHYSGYALKMGLEKWQEFTSEDMPEDTAHALWIAQGSFSTPVKALCEKTEKGYLNIVELSFSEEDEFIANNDLTTEELDDLIPF